jgi:DNA-binding NarL/FixJ family response regulator
MTQDKLRTAVLLDDQPLWLDALEQLLKGTGVEVVGKAVRAEEALALVEQHRPDVLIAGADPGDSANGVISCVRQAHEYWPSVKSVVLSTDEDPQQIEAAFEAGASVYCVKRAAAEDLAVAIRQAFDHSIHLASAYRTHDATGRSTSTSSEAHGAAELTRREIEILQLVAEGHSNSALAKMLWVTEQTVKFHLSNIYRKLNVANRTEASRWAQLHGLLPASAPERTAVA